MTVGSSRTPNVVSFHFRVLSLRCFHYDALFAITQVELQKSLFALFIAISILTRVLIFGTVHGMRETHNEWFARVTRGDSNRQVGTRAKVSDVTLGRQLKAGELSADMIIKIAQAYEESPVVALVDLGLISARWLTEIGTTTALTRATDEELTNELLRRLRLIPDEPADQLAKRRSKKRPHTDPDDGIVREWDDSVPYAADSSPDEDALREERGEDLID